MVKKKIEEMGGVEGTRCPHNMGVDCEQQGLCSKCGFYPLEHAKRVTELRRNILPYYINKVDTEIIVERIRKKNQSR